MTGQRYVAGKGLTSPSESAEGSNPSTAPATAQPLPQPDNRQFINHLADLNGLSVEQLNPAINARLSETPLHYDNLLTGTALLRTVQSLASTDLSTHYVLLLRGEQIVGVSVIAVQSMTGPAESEPLITNHNKETRSLMRAIIEYNADRVLLATVRTDSEYDWDSSEQWEVNRLRDSLETFGVELLEYLLFYDNRNISWVWAEHKDEGFDDGVTITQLEYCGLPVETTADQPTTSTLG